MFTITTQNKGDQINVTQCTIAKRTMRKQVAGCPRNAHHYLIKSKTIYLMDYEKSIGLWNASEQP
jgi:hypothetical protein